MIFGVLMGVLVGVLPGMGGIVGLSVLLPFIYGMEPYAGVALLIGMAAVIHTSDTFPSVLMGIPGSSGSQATILDGYPLAQKGEASRALGAGFISSMFGGIIGGIVLFATVPVFRPVILAFGSPELFMLALLGLSMVGVLSGKSPIKGMIIGALGLMVGAIGGAPAVATYRYTFGVLYLYDGVPLAVVALGLFAFPEMVDLLVKKKSIASASSPTGGIMQGFRDVLQHKWLMFWNAMLGALVGFIPGLGASVVSWINYGVTRQFCKNNETFGQGDIRGVIAPESGNNAKEGGSLIPTLMFGIPGSATAAVILGGLILMGIQPGTRMVTTELPILFSIIWTLVLANIFGVIVCLLLTKPITRLCFIPATKLVPFIMLILVIGAYQSSRHWGDIIAFIAFGLLGWFMKHFNWPRPPLLIGFVLATATERYLWISMSRYGFQWLTFPGVIIIGVATLIVMWVGYLLKRGAEA